ncbi:hypothetical protein ACJX0J_038169 [Zea mays]
MYPAEEATSTYVQVTFVCACPIILYAHMDILNLFLTKLVSFQVVDAKPSCFPVIVDGAANQLTHILLRGTRNSLSRGAVAGTMISCASQEFLNEYKITFLKYVTYH